MVELGAGNARTPNTASAPARPPIEAGTTDVGVDIGLKQIKRLRPLHAHPARPRAHEVDRLPGRSRYYMTVTGEGAPCPSGSAAGAAGTGEIAVSLFPLSPAPPRLEKELETVTIPITKTIVSQQP